MRVRSSGGPGALTDLLLASCLLVPCVFTTRVDAVFIVPKLAVLWATLAVCLTLTAVAVLRSEAAPSLSREHWLVDLAVVSFVGINVAAWAFSTDREQSLYGERLQYQGLLTLLLYVGFFYIARMAISDERRMRLLLAAVAVGGALVSGYALVQRAGLDPIWDGFLPGGRVFSSIGQANALAAYLVLTIPLTATFVFGRRASARGAALVAAVAMFAALALTHSRGGYLGFLAALSVLAVGWRTLLAHSTRRVRPLVAAALVAVLAIVVVVASAGELRRVSTDDPSVRFHLDAWRVAAQIAVEHPVLGTGPETFPDVFPRYSHSVLPADRASALDAFRVESPHNVFLAVAAGSGVLGLTAYLGVIVSFFVALIRAVRSATRELRLLLVAAAATGHLVTDAFMSAEITSTWLFWTLLGATLGAISGTSDRVPPGQLSRHSSTFQVSPCGPALFANPWSAVSLARTSGCWKNGIDGASSARMASARWASAAGRLTSTSTASNSWVTRREQ
jgi:O-antigen ligase